MRLLRNVVNRIALIALLFYASTYYAIAQFAIPDSEIKAILQTRIDRYKKSVAIVVGLVDETGSRVISYGKLSNHSQQDVNGDTIFEIGSVTKVFTTILLAESIQRCEVKINDPISIYLPKSVQTPKRNGKEITLLDLATHTSGLPHMPSNIEPKDIQRPLADYTVERLYAFLSGYTLTRDIGETFEYSNLGSGLLGHILSLRAGSDYEALVVEHISKPLNMNDTRIKLPPNMQAHQADGYDRSLNPVNHFEMPTLSGAGELRSTANDLLKFVAANLGLIKTELLPAMQYSHIARHSANFPWLNIGLGWHIAKSDDMEIIWHNGETYGFHSFVGFDKNKRQGVVVLSNSADTIDDIGMRLLNSRAPLNKFNRNSIKLLPAIFAPYIGKYQLDSTTAITVSQVGDKFFIECTNRPRVELFAETETVFFVDKSDIQFVFVQNPQGQTSRIELYQNGHILGLGTKIQ
jgi:CubicO group peptidase (beta-lactamase class C family)